MSHFISGAGLGSQILSGSDLGISGDVGYNFNKFSIYAAGVYTVISSFLRATLYAEDQTSTYFIIHSMIKI